MPPPAPVLELLQKSVTHAQAESQHEAHLARVKAFTSEPGGWSTVGNFDVDFERIPEDYQRQLKSGQIIGSKGGFWNRSTDRL